MCKGYLHLLSTVTTFKSRETSFSHNTRNLCPSILQFTTPSFQSPFTALSTGYSHVLSCPVLAPIIKLFSDSNSNTRFSKSLFFLPSFSLCLSVCHCFACVRLSVRRSVCVTVCVYVCVCDVISVLVSGCAAHVCLRCVSRPQRGEERETGIKRNKKRQTGRSRGGLVV